MRSHTEAAHAKINLILRILARESSGYHGIETLFQRIALHDVVTVTVDDTGQTPSRLTCHGPALPAAGLGPEAQNLAWRAAEAYCRATAWPVTWQIDITKHIPVGGGLGGGSADAAAVLRALNALAPAPLSPEALLTLGGTLGADVPFMVTGASRAWAWGRGDRLLTLPALSPMAVTLVTFAVGVATGPAYQAFAAHREATGLAVGAAGWPIESLNSWDRLVALMTNDFERVVPAMHAGVAAALPMLRTLAAEQHSAALLSGSGATCFVLHAPGSHVAPTLPAGARCLETTTA